jgi:hypothetical protein
MSFVMYVCPSVHVEQLGSHLADVHKISYKGLLLKFVEKI